MKNGIELISEERQRQIEVKKYTSAHDEDETSFQLSTAAGMFIAEAHNKYFKEHTHYDGLGDLSRFQIRALDGKAWSSFWPWDDRDGRKKADVVTSLIKAGALIAAELDRINEYDPADQRELSSLSANRVIELYEAQEKNRELHSMTEEELIELLTLSDFRLNYELTELSYENGIDFIQENGMWSEAPTVGERYAAFKIISGLGEQQIYVPIIVTTQGDEDTDSYVHPYHISAGLMTGVYGNAINPPQSIEWFIKKGFKIGNLTIL